MNKKRFWEVLSMKKWLIASMLIPSLGLTAPSPQMIEKARQHFANQMAGFEKWNVGFKLEDTDVDFLGQHAGDYDGWRRLGRKIIVGFPPNALAAYPDGIFYCINLAVANGRVETIKLVESQFELVSGKKKYPIHPEGQHIVNAVGKGLIKKVFGESTTQGILVFDAPTPLPKRLELKITAPDGEVEYLELYYEVDGKLMTN
jgi:hypothetical protein